MNFTDYIREYRKANGLSMDEFAAKAGLSKGYISMLENNRNAKDRKPVSPTLKSLKEEYNMFYRAAEGRLRPDPSPAERGDAYDFL